MRPSLMLALAALALWFPSSAHAVCEGLGGDPDGDTICSDGDASGTAGDAPCTCGPLDPPSCYQSCDDNCPFTSNADQLDQGGFNTSAADGIGDACQCGDVSDDSSVNIVDVVLRRRDLQMLGPGLASPEKCRVTDTAECACDPSDVDVIRDALTQSTPDVSIWTCSTLRACYSGPGGTAGVGTCQSGTQTCSGEAWGPCSGEVAPGGEACNAQDDDCDGLVDDDLGSLTCGVGACESSIAACTAGQEGTCLPGTPTAEVCGDGIDNDCDGLVDEPPFCDCIFVTPTGDDLSGDGSEFLPVATIMRGITLAGLPGAPRRVCVARGPSCAVSSTFAASFTMADGIDVVGGFEHTLWTRCGFGFPTWVQPGTAEGVSFPASVTSPTRLDGFRIERAAVATTAGVTVDGGNAVLSNLIIADQPAATVSYGVHLINGAQAFIRNSTISAGAGSVQSSAIASEASTPTIRDNCPSGGVDSAGHCSGYCVNALTEPGILGQSFPGSGGDAYGILLQDSPGATIENSLVCGGAGSAGVGIRIQGESDGVVIRGNTLHANIGTVLSRALWLEDCNGDSPWIVDNVVLQAGGGTATEVHTIHAAGDCHPVIDSNTRIDASTEAPGEQTAVYCGANGSAVASRCSVLDNPFIQSTAFGAASTNFGMSCVDGGCSRVAGNVILGGQGMSVVGLHLASTGSFIERNEIRGGCGTAAATGVLAESAYARLENNLIFSGGCAGAATGSFVGLDVRIGNDDASALDVHSNNVDGGGDAAACSGAALALGTAAVPSSGGGKFRNNILGAGQCAVRYGVREDDGDADPNLFAHNDLDPRGGPTALYRDESAVDLGSAALVNALADMDTGGNLSVDPLFAGVNDFHLSLGSLCIDAGTHQGAPAADFEGQARDALPDIGVDER